jgi:hypothetical protein
MLFGPGIWLWCVPALAVLVATARAKGLLVPVLVGDDTKATAKEMTDSGSAGLTGSASWLDMV